MQEKNVHVFIRGGKVTSLCSVYYFITCVYIYIYIHTHTQMTNISTQ